MAKRDFAEELNTVNNKLSDIDTSLREITVEDEREVLLAQQQYWKGYKAGLYYLTDHFAVVTESSPIKD